MSKTIFISYDAGVISVTQAVSRVDQELLTISVHMSSPPVLVGFLLFNLLVFCVLIFLLSIVCPSVRFSFGHCIVYPSVFFRPLYCISVGFRLLITPFVSSSFFEITNVYGITTVHSKLQYKNVGGF